MRTSRHSYVCISLLFYPDYGVYFGFYQFQSSNPKGAAPIKCFPMSNYDPTIWKRREEEEEEEEEEGLGDAEII